MGGEEKTTTVEAKIGEDNGSDIKVDKWADVLISGVFIWNNQKISSTVFIQGLGVHSTETAR